MRCFRTRGKKGEKHSDPADPPRGRANNRRGHGTYDNDRPPIVGTVGRESGQVRLRVVPYTTGPVLEAHVARFTLAEAWVYTDEWPGYRHLMRPHATVCHEINEWARDDDGDGIREVHVNTVEGLWADVRNFLRPFKGVHKRHLSGYVAIAEFRRNQTSITPALIAQLVAQHTSNR